MNMNATVMWLLLALTGLLIVTHLHIADLRDRVASLEERQ